MRHRITGVGQQVDEDLLQLNRVAEDDRILGAEIHLHLDLVENQLLPDEAEGASHDIVDP